MAVFRRTFASAVLAIASRSATGVAAMADASIVEEKEAADDFFSAKSPNTNEISRMAEFGNGNEIERVLSVAAGVSFSAVVVCIPSCDAAKYSPREVTAAGSIATGCGGTKEAPSCPTQSPPTIGAPPLPLLGMSELRAPPLKKVDEGWPPAATRPVVSTL